MKRNLTKITLALMIEVMLLANRGLTQGVIYNNGAFIWDDNSSAVGFNNGQMVSDSFTLASDSMVTGVNFISLDTAPLTSIDWKITTAAFGGSALASGTASPTSALLIVLGYGSIYSNSISINQTSLNSGTYWLEFENATAVGGGAYWDNLNGTSTAFINNGHEPPFQYSQSQFFQILGTPTATPEPSIFALASLGAASLFVLRRRK